MHLLKALILHLKENKMMKMEMEMVIILNSGDQPKL
jgi:hypothetical protein